MNSGEICGKFQNPCKWCYCGSLFIAKNYISSRLFIQIITDLRAKRVKIVKTGQTKADLAAKGATFFERTGDPAWLIC